MDKDNKRVCQHCARKKKAKCTATGAYVARKKDACEKFKTGGGLWKQISKQ